MAPDVAAAKDLLPGGADLFNTPADGKKKKRRSASVSSSDTPPPMKRRKRATAAAQKARSVERALRDERARQQPGAGAASASRGAAGVEDQACFAFSKRFGPCAKAKAGSKCPSKRAHKCHIDGGPHAAKDNGCKEPKREKKGN